MAKNDNVLIADADNRILSVNNSWVLYKLTAEYTAHRVCV